MWNLGIIALLLGTESLEVGLNTLSKAAMRTGMNNFIFVFYQNIFAILFLVPMAFIYHRVRSPPPRLTFPILCRIVILGLLGGWLQLLTFNGIKLSSPTLASAMNNLTPAYTFILSGITRMEKINLKLKSSRVKSIGTILSITGAFVVTFYNGFPIIFMHSHSSTSLIHHILQSSQSNWVIGGFLLTVGSFLTSVLFIVQTWIMKDYPAELMVALISCTFNTMQSAIVAVSLERNPSAWKLRADTELVAIIYSAVFVISLRNCIYSWALHKKGPLFVTMIKPLGMVIAILMGITFLGDTLYLGSVIGGCIIALGFYSVMWGKAEEEKIVEDSSYCVIDSSIDKVPLLQKKGMVV